MLSHLSIKNYILISELEIDFRSGFSAITGETGTGKSILVGALSLVLGKRADTDVLLNKEGKCIIEGVFSFDTDALMSFFKQHELDMESQLLMRREINKNGKSRAFINDTPVRLPLMKELGEKLVDIHSQHETFLLNESDFQLAVLDNYANNQELLASYKMAFDGFIQLRNELDILISHEKNSRAEEDFIRFQYEEINKANLADDELKDLEDEQEILAHAEEIKSNLFNASQALSLSEDNLIERLSTVLSLTSSVHSYHSEIKSLHERLLSAEIEFKDISNSLARLEEDISFNPARLEEVADRLDLIYNLTQKHKVNDIKDLLKLRDSFENQLSAIENMDDDILKLKKEVQEHKNVLDEISLELRNKRHAVIPGLVSEIMLIVQQLGMEKAIVNVETRELDEFTEWGRDEVEFQFSVNPGNPPAAVAKIASGGELSRLMLALKSLITRKNLLPTVILDEIDMGISGEVAGKVGNLLNSMASSMQLIAITHLPQIAGKANDHFKVYKNYTEDRTVSGVIRLSDEERIDEIAAMLSNETVSKAARDTAKELLEKT